MGITKLGCRVLRGIWLVVLALVLATSTISAANAESKGTIRLSEYDWTGQLVDVHLAQVILEEEMGYEVELVFTEYIASFAALATGDLDVSLEVWPSWSPTLPEWLDKGKVEIVTDMGLVGDTWWAVPTYVVEGDPERGIEPMAPDLKSYKDMNKYAELFARPETGGKGLCLDAIPTWESYNEERIANLGVDYVNIYAGTEGAFAAEIKSAYDRGDPLFICTLWSPHWLLAKYDFIEIELPPYSDECYGLGTDEEGSFACDFPAEDLLIVARTGFKDEYPEAYQFFKNWHLTNEKQAEMLYMVDVEKMDLEAAVRAWKADNEDIWRSWIPK